VNRDFDPSKYSTRLIALKFAYLGQRYNGLEYHANNTTPLPTVEGELWKALKKAHLVFPTPNANLRDGEPNWEGCDYSKCGRTDKGVSAFGQVVGVRVRSDRPLSKPHDTSKDQENDIGEVVRPSDEIELAALPLDPTYSSPEAPSTPSSISWDEPTLAFHPVHDELPYCHMLNRILPPDIRVLAWCPSPPIDFSARFSCRERRYKYFFTQPAFTPTVGPIGLINSPQGNGDGKRREGYLEIPAMRAAAAKFVGTHDFRNLCKLDASKQIEKFERQIFHADIEEANPDDGVGSYINHPGFQQHDTSPPSFNHSTEPGGPKLYAFTLHGSAFLWHQVRHMAAILFLIGQGLEPLSLVDDLLDIQKTPRKPMYEMAEDAPLVLWDCIFPREGSGSREDALEWVYVGDQHATRAGEKDEKFGTCGLISDLWMLWRGKKMEELLAGQLLNLAALQGLQDHATVEIKSRVVAPVIPALPPKIRKGGMHSQKVFQGGNQPRLVGKYVPIMSKPKMEDIVVVNERYARRKGFVMSEVGRRRGFREVNVRVEGAGCVEGVFGAEEGGMEGEEMVGGVG